MMDIQKLIRFLSNDFRNAILSIRKKEGELIPRLNLKEKTKLNGNYMDVYSKDLKRVRKEPLIACNYMLDNFLSNHTIIGVKYFTYNQYHPDKTCFDIITTEGTFTIALGNCNIKDIFPNFVKRVELAKREGIMKNLFSKDIEEINKLKKQLFLGLNSYRGEIKTGIGYYNYNVLSFPRDDKIDIPEYERKFVVKYIQEILKMYRITDDYSYEDIITKLELMKNSFSNPKRSRFTNEELKIGNVTFGFYNDEKALIQFGLIEEAIKNLEKDFIYQTFTDVTDEFGRQLVIKNYQKIGGK